MLPKVAGTSRRNWRAILKAWIPPLVSTTVYYIIVWVVFRFGEPDSEGEDRIGHSFTNAIYFGTVLMSTVGYGDITPKTPWTKFATVLLAVLGIVVVFSQCLVLFSAALAPLLKLFHLPVKRLIKPDYVTVEGPDGRSFDVIVPRAAHVYYAGHLAPPLVVFFLLQCVFSAVMCVVQNGTSTTPLSFGEALYHTMITSTTVGLGDVRIDRLGNGVKWVAVLHIFFTVGLLAAIISDLGSLHAHRKRLLDRIQMILRKCDPELMDQLHANYLDSIEEMSKEEASLREDSSMNISDFPLEAIKAVVGVSDEESGPTEAEIAARKQSVHQDLLETGMDKTEFVVSTLVLLGVLTWQDALPVMRHFDQLDVKKTGRLNAHDFEELSGRPPPKGLEALTKLATRNGVLKEVLKRREHRASKALEEGDFISAASELEAGKETFNDEEVGDATAVRQKVRELTKLGEMKWRYRVVNAGESPRDAALETLEYAKALVLRHEHALNTDKSSQQLGSITALNVHHQEGFRREWATELAGIHHGLGCTRLIFDTGNEQGAAEERLTQALSLRELAVDVAGDDAERWQHAQAGLGDTLNSLGTLKQRQKLYDEARAFFTRSLEVRKLLPDGDDGGKARAQATAQSYVSLGSVETDIGDAVRAETDAADNAEWSAASANEHFATAEEHMQAALQAYVAGFCESHPKVAWAHEGLGKIREKQGRFEEALAAYKDAASVRSKLQQRDAGKQMFKKELMQLQQKQNELARRVAQRKQWEASATKTLMTKALKTQSDGTRALPRLSLIINAQCASQAANDMEEEEEESAKALVSPTTVAVCPTTSESMNVDSPSRV